MKVVHVLLAFAFLLSACSSGTPVTAVPAQPEVVQVSDTPQFTATNTAEPTATLTPTLEPTVTPTASSTPTITPTPLGGSIGYVWSMVSHNVVKIPLDTPNDFKIFISVERMLSALGVGADKVSSLTSDSIAPNGKLVAWWNCNAQPCDSPRGDLYLFSNNFSKKAAIALKGYPSFLGWSADQGRLLYYVGSTVSNEYFLVKTEDPGFGEVTSLGRLSSAVWSRDHQTLYTQKGKDVKVYDQEGVEKQTLSCNVGEDCVMAPSPDGKRFAGIQKHYTTGTGSSIVTVSNADFTENQSIHLLDKNAVIVGLEWLPDNENLVVYGLFKQNLRRRFLHMDYLSVLNTKTGEERVIPLDIAKDVESFSVCGMSPDSNYLVFLGTGERVKIEGRLYLNGRFSYLLPITEDAPKLDRVTEFEEVWENCPVWAITP